MKEALWSETVRLPEFPTLNQACKTDVLVIGGGMCGILCAYYLQKAGLSVILLEGGRIASGTTGKTTAKITSLHGLIYHDLIQNFGKEKASMYLTAHQNAIEAYADLAKEIDFDFERKDAFTYSLKNARKIKQEVLAAQSLGFHADFTSQTELPFNIQGAVCFPNQAQMHPLKLLATLVKELTIYENTMVREIMPNGVLANGHKIKAKQIICATHFPFINKHGSYFLKLYQQRSYVSAYHHIEPLSGMYVDEDEKGFSFKSYQNLFLIGGSSHRTGKKSQAWKALDDFMTQHYPDGTLAYQWATQDCMSLDKIPYIGQYSAKTPNLYVATGFNKWGMTSAMVAANILCQSIQGKTQDYAEIFSPGRSMLKPQLLVNGLESAANLLTPTKRRCPHLGCALKWNPHEHSWDCPCHGSRFNEDGTLLENPATGNIKKP